MTVGTVVLKMEEFCPDTYSVKYVKTKLEEHFGNEVLITNVHGKADVVTFKTTAAAVLNKFYQAPNETNAEAEKLRIIESASKLIKSDIKLSAPPSRPSVYLAAGDISDLRQNLAFIPMSLRMLLGNTFSEKEADLKMIQ